MYNLKTFIKSLLNPHIPVYSKATAAYNGQDNTHFSELFVMTMLIDETQPSVWHSAGLVDGRWLGSRLIGLEFQLPLHHAVLGRIYLLFASFLRYKEGAAAIPNA